MMSIIQFISSLGKRPIPAKKILEIINYAVLSNSSTGHIVSSLKELGHKRIDIEIVCSGFLRNGLKSYSVYVDKNKSKVILYTGDPNIIGN